jgi:hypothetical protein
MSVISLITLAGFPATITQGGTSLVTIDPAAITRAKMVEFDDGITRALVLDYDIVHIWP